MSQNTKEEEDIKRLQDRLTLLISSEIPIDEKNASAHELKAFLQSPKNESTVKKLVDRFLPAFERLLIERDARLHEQGVALFGLLGAVLKQDAAAMVQVILNKLNDAATPSAKQLCLDVLKEYIEVGKQGTSPQQVTSIVSTLLNELEAIDVQVPSNMALIESILLLIERIALFQMVAIKPIFQDVVDVLIGLFLHEDAPETLRTRLSATFLSLRALWISNIELTSMLLDKFIIDMTIIEDKKEPLNKKIKEFSNFVECFFSIVTALSSMFAVCAPKLLSRLLTVFKNYADKHPDQKWLWKVTSDCLLVIVHEMKKEFSQFVIPAMEYLGKMLPLCVSSQSSLNEWVDVVQKVISASVENISLAQIKPLLSSISNYVRISKNSNGAVNQTLGKLYKFLMLNLPAEISKDIVISLLKEVPEILQQPSSAQIIDWSIEQECAIIFNFAMILFCFSSSLQAPRQSEDTEKIVKLFDLLFQNERLWSPFAYYSPSAFLFFFQKLHDFFSSMVLDGVKFDEKAILKALVSLAKSSPAPGTKVQIITWIKTIAGSKKEESEIRALFQSAVPISPFMSALVLDRDPSVRAESMHCIGLLINSASEASDFTFELLELIISRIGDADERVWKAAMDSVTGVAPLLMRENTWEDFNIWKRKHKKPVDSQSTSFQARQFALLFQLFRGDAAQPIYPTLESTLYSAKTRATSQHGSSTIERPSLSLPALERWAVTEAAKHCVFNRLRTILGGPLQTFENLERTLKKYSTQEHLQQSQQQPQHPLVFNRHPPQLDDIRCAQLFLDFVDELEKQIYLAIEAYPRPSAASQTDSKPTSALDYYSQNTLLFFASNKKVCEDWFSRLRSHLVDAAFSYQLGAATQARHTMARLADLRLQVMRGGDTGDSNLTGSSVWEELESDLVRLCGSLADIGESDVIEGIMAWFKNLHKHVAPASTNAPIAHKKFDAVASLLRDFHTQSKGMDEKAAADIQRMLDGDDIRLLSPSSVKLAIDHISSCYVRLSDWEGLQRWLGTLEEYRDSQLSDAQFFRILEPSIDLKYLGVLSNFDGHSVGDPTSISNISFFTDVSQYGKAALIEAISTGKTGMLEHSKDLATSLRLLDSASAGHEIHPLLSHSYAAELLVNIREGRQHHVDSALESLSNSNLYKTSHDTSLLDEVLWVLKRAPSSAISNVNKHYEAVLLQKCKHAIRHGNFGLASRLIPLVSDPISSSLERARLHFHKNEDEDAVELICTLLRDSDSKSPSRPLSKAALRVSGWIKESGRGELVETLFGSDKNPDADIAEVLLVKSISLSEHTDRRPLIAYADWCLGVGDSLLQAINQQQDGLAILTEGEKGRLAAVAHKAAASIQDEATKFTYILAGVVHRFLKIPLEQKNSPSSMQSIVKGQLAAELKGLLAVPSDTLGSVVEVAFEVWKDARSRILSYHHKALTKYFQALSIGDSRADKRYRETNVNVALGLLRFFLCHGHEFENEITEGIESTPVLVWHDVIHQVMAHLGNPDPLVQRIAYRIILKVGQSTPHIVVYPLVVGSKTKKGPRKQYRKLVAQMMSEAPEIMNGAQLMVDELSRITVLWEEVWLKHLSGVHSILSKQLHAYKNACNKINATKQTTAEKEQLKRGKYTSLMRPVVAQLETALELTSHAPETRHEHEFQDKYQTILEITLNAIKNPQPSLNANEMSIDRILHTINQLGKKFSQIHRRAHLRLEDISPVLAHINGGSSSYVIPVPGAETDSSAVPTVSSFQSRIDIIPSKTKPKKLSMLGSDGRKYTFLLKGFEDLHLDEHMMQFLRIVNLFLLSDRESRSRNLHSRHYAVIPLGDRSGLIRWVDGTDPIFSLYRNWKQRKTEAETLKQQASKDGEHPKQDLLKQDPFRPVDVFFSKLIPALKEYGVTNVTSRSDWPKEVLKKVLKELTSEMPRDILAKEIWIRSSNVDEWWDKTKTFNRSVAVMSMIGYIIGLGDRHLDNILVDYTTGDVVHIDYSVCFDKGLKLKVPEVVPFRMTPVIQTALGLTGVEGMFRGASELTLSVMRRSKDTLLMLLEAFIYDPLVDWTSAKPDENLHGKENLEVKVSLGLFTARIKEMKDYMEDIFKKTAQKLDTLSKAFDETQSFYHKNNQFFSVLKPKLDALNNTKEILEATNNAKAQLLGSDFEQTKRQLEQERSNLIGLLSEEQLKFASFNANNQKVVESLRDDKLEALPPFEIPPSIIQSPQLSQLAQFLPNFQLNPQTLAELVELEQNMSNLLMQRNISFNELVKRIQEYRAIAIKVGPEALDSLIISNKCFAWNGFANEAMGAITQFALNATSEDSVVKKLDEICNDITKSDDTAHDSTLRAGVEPLKQFLKEIDTISKSIAAASEIQNQSSETVGFMEKSLVDAHKNLMQFLATQDPSKADALFEYMVAYSFCGIAEKLEGTTSQSLLSSGLEDASLEESIEEPLEGGSLECGLEDESGAEPLLSQELCSTKHWDNFLRLSRSLSSLFIVSQLEKTTTNNANTQLSMLVSTLQLSLHGITEFISSFSNVMFPELVKAFRTGDPSMTNAFRSMAALASSSTGFIDESVRQAYTNLVTIATNDQGAILPNSAGNVLLAGLDGVLASVEKRLTSDISKDRTTKAADAIFAERLAIVGKVCELILGLFSSNTRVDTFQVAQTYIATFASITGYLERLIKIVFIPSLASLSNTWTKRSVNNIAKATGSLEVTENINRSIIKAIAKSLFQSSDGPQMCGILLDGLLSAQQGIDEEKFCQFVSMNAVTTLQSFLQGVQDELHQYTWNNDELVEYFEREGYADDDSQLQYLHWKKKLLNEIEAAMKILDSVKSSLGMCFEKYSPIEDEIVQQISWMYSYNRNPQYQMLLTNIEQRRQIFTSYAQKDIFLLGLAQAILQMESFRTRSSPFTDEHQQKLVHLISRLRDNISSLSRLATEGKQAQSKLNQLEETEMQASQQLQKLSAELGGDSTELQKQYERINSSYKPLQQQLQNAAQAFAADSSSLITVVSEIDSLAQGVWRVIAKFPNLRMKKSHYINSVIKELAEFTKEYAHLVKEELVNQTIKNLIIGDSGQQQQQQQVDLDAINMQELIERVKQGSSFLTEELMHVCELAADMVAETKQQKSPKEAAVADSDSAEDDYEESSSDEDESDDDNEEHTASGVDEPSTPTALVEEHASSNAATAIKPEVTVVTTTANVHVLSMLESVRMKLEGRTTYPPTTTSTTAHESSSGEVVVAAASSSSDAAESSSNKPLSVKAQVHALIQQATSLDNLCVMYEGWQPWL